MGIGASLDEVRDFSRHRSIHTLLTYRDRLTNKQSQFAALVAGTVKPKQ